MRDENLFEGLTYKSMEGMMKPTMHIDEFASKMGEDDDVIVVSFFVRDRQAARDLVSWFENGYDWILDAESSPGEIKPNRFLVYIELRRRMSVIDHLQEILDDLSTLTEFTAKDWLMVIDKKELPWDPEQFRALVPLSPKAYREIHEKDLNEVREAAGLSPRPVYQKDQDLLIRQLKSAAGF